VILSRRGLVKHDDVQPGDETIGYNPETGRNEWTRVIAVHHYEDALLVRIGNSRWHATVTPEHRWISAPREYVAAEPLPDRCPLCPWPEMPGLAPPLSHCPECGWEPLRPGGVALHRRRKHGVIGANASGRRVERFRRRGQTTEGGLRIHLAKAHGIARKKPHNQHGAARFVATKDLTSRDRLVLAAKADTGPGLDITEHEASLLGWIAGDGHVEKYVDKPRGRKKPSISIAQSKPAMVAKLEALMAGVPCAHYAYDAPPSRVNKKLGSVRHTWRLDYEYAQDLMRWAGHPKEQAVAQVLGMSAGQRRAWLDAFIDAEGHRDGEYVSVTQAHGPLLEAAHLAIYLCGYRPRLKEIARQDPAWSPTAWISAGRPVVSGSFLKREDAGRGAVWCVTTELGSWTAEQDGQLFLTGNSDSNAQAGPPRDDGD
jgi:hypothetical protein